MLFQIDSVLLKFTFVTAWSSWYIWEACSVTCGGGTRSRSRVCRNGSNCPGENKETETCNSSKCGSKSLCSGLEIVCLICSYKALKCVF